MSAVIEASGLGKRYRRQWALTDCTLSIPAGHVVGLVGPNGAGKTTLLNLAVGLLAPDAGTIEVLGGTPGAGQAELARVGFLAQDSPAYAGLSVADHLKLGAHLNPGWDPRLARGRVDRLDRWTSCWLPTTCSPARAGTWPRCRTAWRSSPPATPTCRPR